MMVGAVTLEAVIPLPVRSAVVFTVVFHPVAAARLKVALLTAVVPLLFKTPFTASLSAVLSVTEKAVALLAVTPALLRV